MTSVRCLHAPLPVAGVVYSRATVLFSLSTTATSWVSHLLEVINERACRGRDRSLCNRSQSFLEASHGPLSNISTIRRVLSRALISLSTRALQEQVIASQRRVFVCNCFQQNHSYHFSSKSKLKVLGCARHRLFWNRSLQWSSTLPNLLRTPQQSPS